MEEEMGCRERLNSVGWTGRAARGTGCVQVLGCVLGETEEPHWKKGPG